MPLPHATTWTRPRFGERPARWALAVLAVGTWTLLASGCGSGNELRTCHSQDDCSQDQVCQAGYCVDLCQSHDDCTYPRVCDDGFCIIPDRCRSQDDCEYDEACISGRCIPQIPECDTAADCPPGHYCDRGACVLRPDQDDLSDGCQTSDQCPADLYCSDNQCLPGGSDPEPEGEEIGDGSVAEQAPDGADVPDNEPDAAEDQTDEMDECEGRGDGQLGDVCHSAQDCCNGLCLGNPDAGEGICTQACSTYADCNPEGLSMSLFCYELQDQSRYCAPSDFLESCSSPDTCTGEVCLHGYGTSGCSWFCDYTRECPPDTACGLVSFWDEEHQVIVDINTCAPVGNPCTVDSGTGFNDCLSGICLTEEGFNTGFCSTFCNDYGDPQPCPTGYRCVIVEAEYPPVCIP